MRTARSLLVVAGVLALAFAVVALNVPAQAVARPTVTTREIQFQVQGEGRAQDSAIVTRSIIYRVIPSHSTKLYASPSAAFLTVRSYGGEVTCRIFVDRVLVAEQSVNGDNATTCLWVAGAEQLPTTLDLE